MPSKYNDASSASFDGDSDAEKSLLSAPTESEDAASKQSGFYRVLVFILIAAMANILFGYENSVVASGVNDFMGALSSTDSSNQGLLKGALAIGATIVCPFAGLLQDGIGRRVTLIICLIIYLGCCAISATAPAYPGGFSQLMCGRVLTGMVIGIFSSTVPMYVAELSPANIRGSLVTINQVCVCVGILLGYVASTVLTPSWRPQFYGATPLAVLLLCAFVFVTPYSPRWLMTKGRKEEARAVLRSIRGNDAAAEKELDDIQRVCDESSQGVSKYAALLEPHIRWGVTIGVMGAIMQQWVGVNAVNGYAPNIFEGAGSTPAQAHVQTIYIGVAKLFFVVVALLLMDRVGRKPLLIIGCIGMAASSGMLAFSYSLPANVANPIAVGSLVLYMAFFEISLGPILWLLLSELYPLKVKGVAMSIGATMTWAMTYAVNQTYLPISKAITTSGSFYLYAVVSALSAVWIYFFVFETKGRTLEEIQDLLKGVDPSASKAVELEEKGAI